MITTEATIAQIRKARGGRPFILIARTPAKGKVAHADSTHGRSIEAVAR